MSSENQVVELTDEQLEQAAVEFAKRKKNAVKKRQKERDAYELQRDRDVRTLIQNAMYFEELLAGFKYKVQELMDKHHELLNEYGGIRGNSKGGFSITSNDNCFRIVRLRSTEPHWDERSTKAIELIKDFLGDTVKKRDQKVYEVLISFIQRNENGDLEYAKVMNLMQHRDKWDDERWLLGLQLIEESYSIHLRGFGYEFKRRDSDKKWVTLCLSFSSSTAKPFTEEASNE